MAVIGASPALTYVPVSSQAFSGNGSQTVFTLNASVNANTDIEVLVDNVQQSPYDSSYTVGGTTLTFSEAPASGTNNVYVVYRAVRITATTQMIPDNGSVTTSKLSGNLTTPGNLSVTGTAEILGGSGGAALTLKNGADIRLQNADNTANVHVYCDLTDVMTVSGKVRSASQSMATAQSSATAITVATITDTAVASCALTTTGKAVYITACGDANPNQAGGWHWYMLYRDGSIISKKYINENAGGVSKNCPFAINHIDYPAAGSHTYELRVAQGSGSFLYGESGDYQAPSLSVMEVL